MIHIAFNVLLSAALISTALWVAKTNPILAGFIVSLPLSTLITLAFAKFQTDNPGDTVLLAKSIFVGVPATLLFFVPFLMGDKLKLSFWTCYFSGFGLLIFAYGAHRWVMNQWMK